MTKKKICTWFDANQVGAIRFEHNTVWACCYRSIPLISNIMDFSKISVSEIIQKRNELYEGINNQTRHECDGCQNLCMKNEAEINLNKINSLILLPFTTCNLRCKYCYLSKEQLGSKMQVHKVLPIIENLKKQNFLTDNFELCLGGGEPLLLDDLPETAQYMQKNFVNSTFKIMSNFTISSKVNELINTLKDLKGICRKTYTSIDCGTPESYKKIRGSNLFYTLIDNLYNAASSGAFDIIELKYLLLEDGSNLSDEDIFGFLDIVKFISKNSKATIWVTIDADYGENRIDADENKKDSLTNKPISDEMLNAAAKIYYVVTNYLNATIWWSGGRITDATAQGKKDINRIISAGNEYINKPKTNSETFYLSRYCNVTQQNQPAAKNANKLFSIVNEERHKVITILGLKIKFRRQG